MGSKKEGKKGPRLGLFVANLLGTVVFGTIWFTFNIVLGNLVALRFLGWMNHLPQTLSTIASLLPSTGQLLFEEHSEYQARQTRAAKREAERVGLTLKEYLIRQKGEEEEEGLDKAALGFIALSSTTLDIIGPALGIMVTVTIFGGEMAVAPAVVLAFGASWMCQRIAWRCLKATIRMTWEAFCEVATAPFQTKIFRAGPRREQQRDRKGDTIAFQQRIESPKEEEERNTDG